MSDKPYTIEDLKQWEAEIAETIKNLEDATGPIGEFRLTCLQDELVSYQQIRAELEAEQEAEAVA